MNHLEEAIRLIDQIYPDIDAKTKYMLLASFVMYFKSPLKSEPWNSFPRRIDAKILSVREGLLSTDEQKNPHFWSDAKISTKEKTTRRKQIVEILLATRDSLTRKRLFRDERVPGVVPVLDSSAPHADPTFFPADYLRSQIYGGNYVNELTGQPLSWMDVEQLRRPQALGQVAQNASTRNVSGAFVLKGILRELDDLKRSFEVCAVCRKRTRQFKTLRDHRTVYFCSLACLSKWDG